MTTPHEDIDALLEDIDSSEAHRLEISILVAQSMLFELRMKVAEWEATTIELQRRRRPDLALAQN